MLAFDKERRRFRLASVHPGRSVEEVRANTGFAFDEPAEAPMTPAPDAESLNLIRDRVGSEIAEIDPQFSERLRQTLR